LLELNLLVHDIHVKAFPEYFKPLEPAVLTEWFRTMLARRDVRTCLADLNGASVGYALAVFRDRPENDFCFARRICEVDQIGVAPGFRGRGVARALLDHVVAIARTEGVPDVELTSWSFNSGAHRAFERAGFRSRVVRFGRRST
jgi:ribosomal protein S18 acetylase RimI-like enzyme